MNKIALGRIGCVLFLGLCGLLSLKAWAEGVNPYLGIADRNAFLLKDPPPLQEPITEDVAPPPPPGVTIKLTGIASIFKPPKATFEITQQGPGGEIKKPILSAGEKLDDLEVISIDPEKSLVTIRHSGAVSNITFTPIETASSAPANPGAKGRPVPGRPAVGIPNAAAAAAAANAAANAGPTIITRGGGTVTDGGRGISMYGGETAQNPTAPASTTAATVNRNNIIRPTYNANATAAAGNANRLRNLPTRNITVDTPNSQTPRTSQPTMTQEQLKLWIEANRAIQPQLPWPSPGPAGGAPVEGDQ